MNLTKYQEKIFKDITQKILNILISQDEASQFVMQELDFLRLENISLRNFIDSVGIKPYEFVGSINKNYQNSLIKQHWLLKKLLLQIENINLRNQISLFVIKKIIIEWNLGKYNDSGLKKKLIDKVNKVFDYEDEIFANINDDLSGFFDIKLFDLKNLDDQILLLSYINAKKFAMSALVAQGLMDVDILKVNLKKLSNHEQIVKPKNNSVKLAIQDAIFYLQSYDERITKSFFTNLISDICNSNEMFDEYKTSEELFEIY